MHKAVQPLSSKRRAPAIVLDKCSFWGPSGFPGSLKDKRRACAIVGDRHCGRWGVLVCWNRIAPMRWLGPQKCICLRLCRVKVPGQVCVGLVSPEAPWACGRPPSYWSAHGPFSVRTCLSRCSVSEFTLLPRAPVS